MLDFLEFLEFLEILELLEFLELLEILEILEILVKKTRGASSKPSPARLKFLEFAFEGGEF